MRPWQRVYSRFLSGDRGSMAVEFVVAAPALVLLLLLVAAGGQWLSATGDVGSASRDAVRAASLARTFADAQANAQSAATSYYRGLNTSLISGVTAQAAPAPNGMVSVTIKGKMTGIWPLTISETVTGPIECFRTQASQGVACG